MVKTSHLPDEKKQVIKDYVKLSKEYPIIAAVNMENLPTRQVQTMRAQLRGKVVLLMSKRRLIKIAIEQAEKEKPGIIKLLPYLKGMPALLFTKDNPFSLYKTLAKNKSSAPIKGGQKATKDIIVPAGPTGFAPGPIIAQLNQVGITAGIDAGKVVVKKDSLVAKEGAVVKAELASMLARLNINPMEIGLDLVAAFEGGQIFTKDLLAVDEKEYVDKITQAHQWAFNLAIEAAITGKDTSEFLVTKAFNDAKALARECNIYADAVMPELLAKAHNQMLGLKSMVPDN